MKRNKLLIPLITTASLAPTISLVGCGESNTLATDIVKWIMEPADLQSTKITGTFKDALKALSDEDKKKELFYDLFGAVNVTGQFCLEDNDTFNSLYKQDKVAIKCNVTKYTLCFSNDKLMVDFLGYISFVFTSDYSDNFKQNDYAMLTFDINDQEVTIDETNCSLKYSVNSKYEQACVGFLKSRHQNGKESMYYIKNVNTNWYKVKNSHNWTK